MRIAFISDIHEDYHSLKTAARLIEKKQCDTIVCLGDIVGYSVPYYNYFERRDGSACVKWVRDNCRFVVAGNHDLYALKKLPFTEVRGFKYPTNWYELSFVERKKRAQHKLWLYEDSELSALLDNEDLTYLNTLPEFLEVEFDKYTCLLSHFVHPDLTGSTTTFIDSSRCLKKHFGFMQSRNLRIGFSGHMHSEGTFCANAADFQLLGYGRKLSREKYYWFSVPCIADAMNKNGFLIWDTHTDIIETVPIKKMFNFYNF